jgi:hypothetical protein
MFYNDHAPPHFHAIYNEHEALIGIDTFDCIARLATATGPGARSGMGDTSP